jgi:hypothetical protein
MRIGSMLVANTKWGGRHLWSRPGAPVPRAVTTIAISTLWLTAVLVKAPWRQTALRPAEQALAVSQGATAKPRDSTSSQPTKYIPQGKSTSGSRI